MQALAWVNSMDLGRISFRYACETLGIEPERVQQTILARADEQRPHGNGKR